MIRLVTTIGYGSPNMAGTPGVHGAALGEEEAKLTREKLEWSYGEWEVPDEVRIGLACFVNLKHALLL
jgi:transketolase